MWSDVKVALRAGVICGVQYGVAALIVAAVLAFMASDYAVVRQRAANGQMAYQAIQQQMQARAKAQEKP